jgi:malonyl-CoA O-methyltransferase
MNKKVITPLNPYTLDINHAREAFSTAASVYDSAAVLQREVAERMIERLDLVRLQPKRMLDLGCGTGHVTRLLRQRYPEADIVSVDMAFGMAAYAQANYSNALCADTNHLPFQDQSIDLIVSNLMLHWCNDLGGVTREWRRVLRPEGLLMFSVFGPDTLQELRSSWSQVDSHIHVHAFWDMHDVGDALVKARFADPVMDMEYFTLTYPHAKALMSELKALGMHNVAQGRSRGLITPRQLAQAISAYEAYRNPDDQRLPATYEVIYGHAWGPSLSTDAAMDEHGEVRIPISRLRKS